MFRIEDGRNQFYQWDSNRRIIVSDPTITEVHFCNKTDDCSLVVEVYEEGGNRLANVPNILLQQDWPIYVYGYCGDCFTKQEAIFKVAKRTKPADYVYTETEVKSWENIEKRCNEVLDVAEGLAHGAASGKSFISYQALVEELNAAGANKYHNPQHFYIKTMGVPDVWVYEVSNDYVEYTYTDDNALSEALVNSTVQIGYYILSALETQKVNLEDYAKTEDLDTKADEWQGHQGGYYTLRCRARGGDGIDMTRYLQAYNAPLAYAIPLFSSEGQLQTNTPTADKHCANKKYVDDNFVKAVTTTTTNHQVYVKSNSGTQLMFNIENGPVAGTICMRDGNGRLRITDPAQGTDCATKNYVDNAIAALKAQLGLE